MDHTGRGRWCTWRNAIVELRGDFAGRHLPQIEAFKKRMEMALCNGCRRTGMNFNRDYHVSFTKEEKASGKVYYNYEVGRHSQAKRGRAISVFLQGPGGKHLPTRIRAFNARGNGDDDEATYTN